MWSEQSIRVIVIELEFKVSKGGQLVTLDPSFAFEFLLAAFLAARNLESEKDRVLSMDEHDFPWVCKHSKRCRKVLTVRLHCDLLNTKGGRTCVLNLPGCKSASSAFHAVTTRHNRCSEGMIDNAET